jgi:hypothetical protein
VFWSCLGRQATEIPTDNDGMMISATEKIHFDLLGFRPSGLFLLRTASRRLDGRGSTNLWSRQPPNRQLHLQQAWLSMVHVRGDWLGPTQPTASQYTTRPNYHFTNCVTVQDLSLFFSLLHPESPKLVNLGVNKIIRKFWGLLTCEFW